MGEGRKRDRVQKLIEVIPKGEEEEGGWKGGERLIEMISKLQVKEKRGKDRV